jgi:hypothetical protein
MTDSRFSFAPLGDPGSVNMSVFLRIPATGLAIKATKRHQRLVRKAVKMSAYKVLPDMKKRACRDLTWSTFAYT